MEDEIDKCKDTKLCRYLVSQTRDLCKYLIIILALKFIVVIILRRLGLLLPLNSLEGVRKWITWIFSQDELNLYYDVDETDRVAVVGFIGPGYTTYSYLNAGYRIYTMDGNYKGSTHQLLNAKSYFLNVTGRNLLEISVSSTPNYVVANFHLSLPAQLLLLSEHCAGPCVFSF